MRTIQSFIKRLFYDQEKGATATEYAIILALIAGVIVAAVSSLGQAVSRLFSAASNGW